MCIFLPWKRSNQTLEDMLCAVNTWWAGGTSSLQSATAYYHFIQQNTNVLILKAGPADANTRLY